MEPYRIRSRIRKHLPWFLINLGICAKGKDCESRNGPHDWYNHDGKISHCYHCKIEKEGCLWLDEEIKTLPTNE